MFESDFRIFFADLDHGVTPNLGSFQNIGLVYADKVFAAAHRGLECDVGNSFNFGNSVTHRVKTFFSTCKNTVRADTFASGLAEINVTGEFANEQKIQTGNKFGFQGRSSCEFRIANGRTKIHKKA